MSFVKEAEKPLGQDNLASQEVDGYIERIEKQAENTNVQSASTAKQVSDIKKEVVDMGKVVSSQFATKEKEKIILPIGEAKLKIDVKSSPKNGVRWLAEWCLFMMKKYPGRVFYMPSDKSE